MLKNPPSITKCPAWATALVKAKHMGGTDFIPYYWTGEENQYQRCTAKNIIHKFGGSNQDIDNMAIIVGNMPNDMRPDNLCFGAKWISPETNKPVTALHFSSFIDCIRDIYNIPHYKGNN